MSNPQITNTTGTHQRLDTSFLRSRDDILNLFTAAASQPCHHNSKQGIPRAIDTDNLPWQHSGFEKTHVHTSNICIRIPT